VTYLTARGIRGSDSRLEKLHNEEHYDLYWPPRISGIRRNFFRGGVSPEIFFGEAGGSTNSVEDRGQRERRSGSVSPLVRGSTQFANE
jgi:hypothetical protein